MTDREREIIRMALIYAQSNLDDVLIAFGQDEDDGPIWVSGDQMDGVTEDEVDELLKVVS